MNPDIKHMNDSKNNFKDDMKLVPFTQNNPWTLPNPNWIPILIFVDPNKLKNLDAQVMFMPTNMNYPLSTDLTGFSNSLPTKFKDLTGITNTNNNTNGSNPNSNNEFNFTNYNSNVDNASSNPNLYPSENSSDNLYSYNNQGYTSSNNRVESKITEILKSLDINLDEDTDLVRHCNDKRIEKIFCYIEKKHPEIFALFNTYEIPDPITKLIIRRIINVTLKYCKKAGD